MTAKPVKGYIVDVGNEIVAFVRLHHDPSRWVKTHPCVLLKKCGYCGAARGSLCVGSNSLTIEPHSVRKKKLTGSDWKDAIKTVPGMAVTEALRKENRIK